MRFSQPEINFSNLTYRAYKIQKRKEEPKLLKCKCCGKQPSEIGEYITFAGFENITPDEFVWREEGTLNRETGFFYCTKCYINLGMPLGVA